MSLMSSKKLLMQGARKIRPQDVFATGLYSGDGAARSFSPGIDLAGKGGLLWLKRRSGTAGASPHSLFDTVRGMSRALSTDAANAENAAYTGVSATSDGWLLAATPSTNIADLNASGASYVNWYFRRAKKFFDTVTYTGNGQSGRQIPHGLGDVPGMITIKARSSAGDWPVYHRSLGVNGYLFLNDTGPRQTVTGFWGTVTDTTFTVPSLMNTNGTTYVAYIFAHNSDLIQCTSFTTNASGAGSINHGWGNGSQFAMLKAAITTGDWEMFDTARSPNWTTDLRLRANLSNVEDTVTRLSEAGGVLSITGLAANQTYIAMLVRAPT